MDDLLIGLQMILADPSFAENSVTLIVVGVIALAVLVRSIFGFGDALVAMPLLLLVMDLHQAAVALVALVSLITAVVIFGMDRRRLDLAPGTFILAGSALPGLCGGLWFLQSVSAPVLTTVLGGAVAVVGLMGVITDPRRWRIPPRTAGLFGLLAGFLGGAFNVHGPPLVIFGTAAGWSAERFRVTMQAYFLAAGVFLVGGHALAGRYDSGLLVQCGVCLPVVVLASWGGRLLNRRLSVERFRLAVYLVLLLLGLFLVLQSIRGQ